MENCVGLVVFQAVVDDEVDVGLKFLKRRVSTRFLQLLGHGGEGHWVRDDGEILWRDLFRHGTAK